jgi:hypothetical protein
MKLLLDQSGPCCLEYGPTVGPRRVPLEPEVPVETLLDLLGGPVFRFSLVVALLGTLSQFAQNALVIARSAGGIKAGIDAALAGIGRWLSPAHRVRRIGWLRELLTWLSIAGLVVVPLFYLGHARLWGRYLDVAWPAVAPGISDLLTKATMLTLAALLIATIADRREREARRATDWLPLSMGLVAFVTGYLVAHPGRSPLAPDTTAFLHYASANVLLLAIPFTRFARCVLIPEAFEKAVEHRKEVGA